MNAGPAKVAISKGGASAYVVNPTGATVSVFNTVSDTVASTIPVGANAAAIALAKTAQRPTAVIDTASKTVVATFTPMVPTGP